MVLLWKLMELRRKDMATEGMVRKIDKLGRIVVPIEFRKSLGIQAGEDVEIRLEGNFIKVCKHEDGCVFCGEKTKTNAFKWI